MQAQRGGPSLTTPCHLPTGFSTIAQLKRRNTLKDGIIMIQTLLIILFIIVPIFLLLDKVTTGAGGGGHGAGQTWAGSPSPQPHSLPTDTCSKSPSFVWLFWQRAPHLLTPRPSPPTPPPGPVSLTLPSLAQQWMGWGKLTLCSPSLAPPG